MILIPLAMALDLAAYPVTPYRALESNPLAASLPDAIALKVIATVLLLALIRRMGRYQRVGLAVAVAVPLIGAASALRFL